MKKCTVSKNSKTGLLENLDTIHHSNNIFVLNMDSPHQDLSNLKLFFLSFAFAGCQLGWAVQIGKFM